MHLELYNKVGPAGVALVFLSGLSLYLALRNGVYLFMVSRDFRRTLPDIDDFPQYAQKLCEKTDNPLVGIIAGAFSGASNSIRRRYAGVPPSWLRSPVARIPSMCASRARTCATRAMIRES